jgi:uncharacterized OB-fold protein
MPFCPACRSEYRAGFTQCSDCGAELVDELPVSETAEAEPGHDDWVVVYEGTAGSLKVIENRLRAMLIPCVTLPAAAQPMGALAEYDTPHLVVSRLLVPPEIYDLQQRAIEMAVVTGSAEAGEVDVAVIQEASEDYDVRACPQCVYYFHDSYLTCPGCGAELLPAVEVFEEGQIEPDRVVVYSGPEADAQEVAGRLQAAGFAAEAFGVEDWPVFAADLPWRELINRTTDAEAVLAGVPVPPPAPAAPPPTAAPGEPWVTVLRGATHAEVAWAESRLEPLGVRTQRLPAVGLTSLSETNSLAHPASGHFDLQVPPSRWNSDRAAIEAALAAPDPAAEAEAEEDFDVRACADCGYFFHDFFTACAGCGAALVPGIEIFEEGQMEPDRVIVATGDEAGAQAIADRLRGAGFDAEAFGVEDWPVFAVDVPWGELTDRTADLERLARG